MSTESVWTETAPTVAGIYDFWCAETGYASGVKVWSNDAGALLCDLDCGFVNPPVFMVHRGLTAPRWRRIT